MSDTLVPGETKFYRMNVDWGQRPLAEVEFDKKQTDSYRSGQVFVASPRRTHTSYSNAESLDDDIPVTARAVSTPYVFYRNREGSTSQYEATDAGQWYVMVTLDGGDENGKQDKDIEFRLSTALDGDKVDGPEWRQTLEPGPAPSTEPSSDNDGGAGNSNANPDVRAENIDNAPQNNTILLIGLGLLAIVLIIVVAVLVAARRN